MVMAWDSAEAPEIHKPVDWMRDLIDTEIIPLRPIIGEPGDSQELAIREKHRLALIELHLQTRGGRELIRPLVQRISGHHRNRQRRTLVPRIPSLALLVLSHIGRVFASGDSRDAEILALRHQILGILSGSR